MGRRAYTSGGDRGTEGLVPRLMCVCVRVCVCVQDGTWSMLELTLGGMAKADLLGGYLLNPDPDAHTGTGSHTQTPRTRPKAASPGRRAGQPLPPTGMQARAAGLKARSARMSASGVASSSNDKPAAFGALPEALMSSGGTADGDLNSNSNPDSNKPGLSVVTSDLLALRRGQWLAVVIADALLAQLPRPKRVSAGPVSVCVRARVRACVHMWICVAPCARCSVVFMLVPT